MTTKALTADELALQLLQLFDGGKNWTTNAFARDGRGLRTDATAPQAIQFCLMGGAERVAGPRYHATHGFRDLMRRLQRITDYKGSLMDWNDSRESYGEVKVALEAALENGK